MRDQYVKYEIEAELNEYQNKRRWIEEANHIYRTCYFASDAVVFTASDFYKADGLSPTEYVREILQEKDYMESDLPEELGYPGIGDYCSRCGNEICDGDCDETAR